MFYETHITVEPHDVSRWQTLCEKLKIKPLLIELSSGDYPLHLMCSAPFSGSEADFRTYLVSLERQIRQSGFSILRVKPETLLDQAGFVKGPIAYYECHIKLLLEKNAVRHFLRFSQEHGLHPSRNLLYGDDGEVEKWYLTTRLYNGSIAEARRRFRKAFLETKRIFPAEKISTECAVWDTNPALDTGWIEQ